VKTQPCPAVQVNSPQANYHSWVGCGLPKVSAASRSGKRLGPFRAAIHQRDISGSGPGRDINDLLPGVGCEVILT
jgi:hypothetical protein